MRDALACDEKEVETEMERERYEVRYTADLKHILAEKLLVGGL